ncbi:MAG: hypothetical protein NT001_05045 [Candidatus Woesearchaeota archaeon]|nr:hypothetical protein [Candidatus Woesearchaeota archaeon]
MGEDSKKQEWLITACIPLIVTIIFGVLSVSGDKYRFQTVIIGSGMIVIMLIIFFCIRFLEQREKRWIKNRAEHLSFNNQITQIRHKMDLIENNQNINGKINKLESDINYIRGRLDNPKK